MNHVLLYGAIRLVGDDDRKGGYCCVADHEGRIHAVFLVGQLPDREKREKYFYLCQEKAARLAQHSDHISSWQSRNPQDGRWGGAVKGREFILSFSGLPELWDEASMLVAARSFYPRLISEEGSTEIEKLSGNPHVQKLLATVKTESSCSDPAS
ncbi:MAG TPA: hypothetical protein VJH94_01615 [Candidatus Paceibacterota bacterium]